MSAFSMGMQLMQLQRSQWWPEEKLHRYQDQRLRAIIKYAYETIPLYHQKFKAAGIHPDQIKTVSDLPKIPVLTKQEIQQNYPTNIIAPHIDIKNCWTPFTSGSTGNPVTIVYDDSAESFQKACALRPNLACGQRLFDSWAVIASPRTITRKKKKRWFQKFGLFSQVCFSLFETPQTHVAELEKINPDILDGYTTSLYLIAQEIKRTDNHKIHPHLVYTTSELLTPQMRTFMNDVFNLEVYDQFGSVEMGRTAWECPEHTGYHMDMEAVVSEFIRDGEQVTSGERGEIVYTNLYNYAMPFIRLRTQDVSIPSNERCPCGRTLPLMKLIEGRVDDFIILPNGRLLPPVTWIILLMYNRIDQFKVIQETVNELRVQVVPKQDMAPDALQKIHDDVVKTTENLVNITIEPVTEIKREPSGKTRPIVSKVKWTGCCV
jgi:phenylacetate-CoA ligase